MPLLETPEPDLEPEVRPRAQRVPEPCPAGSPRRAWRALRTFRLTAAPAQELRRHEAGLGAPARPAPRARQGLGVAGGPSAAAAQAPVGSASPRKGPISPRDRGASCR